ncbi:hypothetical protein JVT61DRAFT_10686 [Boletus reticuloceps]|uniref:Uncharacterized protein n=1 Tax=Boletus reticuloceps TaxID=495285 RepID=A0A8I2YFM5_9AGAM|nr:hypothetical protein JVT61DRAFT_10686 [Boletus reticuloceps]
MCGNLHWFQDSLRSFSEFSDIRDLYLLGQSDVTFNKLVSSCICRWGNLQIVHCPEISLDVDALAHLSRMPVLTQLSFKQIVVSPDCHSALFFSDLLRLVLLQSPSLGPISHLLSWIRLPVIEDLIAEFHNCPSRQDLASFFAGIQTSNTGHTMINLSLNHDIVRSEVPTLLLADIQPCMAFSNLHHICLSLKWNVCLTDSDVLEMAAAWPDLK